VSMKEIYWKSMSQP